MNNRNDFSERLLGNRRNYLIGSNMLRLSHCLTKSRPAS